MRNKLVLTLGIMVMLLIVGTVQAQDQDSMAFVRVINLSPNAENVSVELRPTSEDREPIEQEGWAELQYRDRTEFQQVGSGEVDIHATIDGITVQETFTMDPQRYYTIALTGLVVPEEFEQRAAEDEEGFWGWMQDLFTDDDAADTYRFQVRIDEEDMERLSENEMRIRVVHASPGTDAVALAFAGEEDPLISQIAYGEESSYVTTDRTGELEFRIAGSSIRMQDVLSNTDIDMTAGQIYTVYLAGTAFQTEAEEAGLHAEVLASQPAPVDSAQDTTTMAQPIAGETQVQDPMQDQMQEQDFTASVRVIHLSPNAGTVSVELHPTSDYNEPIMQEEWNQLEYLDRTDFQQVVAAEVDVRVTVDGITVKETFSMNPQGHYTIALTGLVVPEELEKRAAEDDGGFWGWVRDLFSGDDTPDRYSFQIRIEQDDLEGLNANEMRIRVVHASPGTDAVDLAFTGEEDVLINDITYGEESSYVSTDRAGELELRIAGSKILMQDMLSDADADITAGQIYTVYLAGMAFETETEDAGIRVEVFADSPAPMDRVRGTTPLDQPIAGEPLPQDRDFTASVRIIHLSPNAGTVTLELHPTSEYLEPILQEEWNELEYLDRTDFHEVVAAQVDVHVTVNGITLQETFSMDPQMHYTIALIGLVVPEDLEQRAAEDEEGFWGWVGGLFTDDDKADKYRFQIRIDQEQTSPLNENEMRIRVVHASPGTAAIDLAIAGEEDLLISEVSYGEQSSYATTDLPGELELRIGGSAMLMNDMLLDADTAITAGQIYTVYLAGMAFETESEEAGVHVEVLATPPDPMDRYPEGITAEGQPMAGAPRADGQPMAGAPQADGPDSMTSLRVIHLAPNAGTVAVELRPTSQDMEPFSQGEWNELEYLERTDFHQVGSGQVDVHVTVEGFTMQETVTMDPRMYYTIALTGLVVPEDLEQRAEEDEEGFWGWVGDLFAGDDATDKYHFQIRIDEEELNPLNENEMRIRVVHASPGTDAVSLAFAGEEDPLVSGVSYGEHSSYVTTDMIGDLELRIAGSSIPMQDMISDADVDMTAGQIYTVYLAGTAFQTESEDAGIHVEVLAAQPDPMEYGRETQDSDESSTEAPLAKGEDFRASLRVIHLAPNAGSVSVELRPTSENGEPTSDEQWSELQYLDRRDFLEVGSSQVDIHVTVEGTTIQETFTMDPRKYYTIALTGLVVPEDLEQRAEEDEEGFWGWLGDLFTGDDATDKYQLQIRMDEEALYPLNENEMRIRVVHASPGTDSVSLAFAGEEDPLVSGVSYGEHSAYVTTDMIGDLELRIAGSSIPMQDMISDADVDMTAGQIYTVYLAGTAFQTESQEAGLHVEVLAAQPDPMEYGIEAEPTD